MKLNGKLFSCVFLFVVAALSILEARNAGLIAKGRIEYSFDNQGANLFELDYQKLSDSTEILNRILGNMQLDIENTQYISPDYSAAFVRDYEASSVVSYFVDLTRNSIKKIQLKEKFEKVVWAHEELFLIGLTISTFKQGEVAKYFDLRSSFPDITPGLMTSYSQDFDLLVVTASNQKCTEWRCIVLKGGNEVFGSLNVMRASVRHANLVTLSPAQDSIRLYNWNNENGKFKQVFVNQLDDAEEIVGVDVTENFVWIFRYSESEQTLDVERLDPITRDSLHSQIPGAFSDFDGKYAPRVSDNELEIIVYCNGISYQVYTYGQVMQ